MSDTVIVAIISSLSALIPSIAIAIINNNYNLKLKKLEIEEINKRDAVINFLNKLGNCCDGSNGTSTGQNREFIQSLNVLLFYFPKLNIDINKIKNLFRECNLEKIYKELTPIINQLSASLK